MAARVLTREFVFSRVGDMAQRELATMSLRRSAACKIAVVQKRYYDYGEEHHEGLSWLEYKVAI